MKNNDKDNIAYEWEWIEKKENKDGTGDVFFKGKYITNGDKMFVPVFIPSKKHLYFYNFTDEVINFYADNLEEASKIVYLMKRFDDETISKKKIKST